MTKITERYVVTFFSPGSFFAESSTEPVEAPDPKLAMALLAKRPIKERYGATPYGFRFERRLEAPPISAGKHGELRVEPKTVWESGMYFIDGKIERYEDIKTRKDPKEEILLSNMCSNGWAHAFVVKQVGRYRTTQPFTAADFVVDRSGNIVERGDDETRKREAERFAATPWEER